jgi:ribonuclease HI
VANPGGHGAFGALVKRHGEVIFSASEYLGHGAHITNNVAEYAGALIETAPTIAIPVTGKL